MPIYEYRCRSCEKEFEELVRSAEAASAVTCPSCGHRKVERKLSVFAARETAPCGTTSSVSPCGRCGDAAGSCGMR